VILEAFAKYLHESDPALSSTEVLGRWLWEKLSMPPQCNVDQVIHCEIVICHQDALLDENPEICSVIMPHSRSDAADLDVPYVFRGTSISGNRLLNSLKEYGLSYESQKWARWVHNIRASDFTVSDAQPKDDKTE